MSASPTTTDEAANKKQRTGRPPDERRPGMAYTRNDYEARREAEEWEKQWRLDMVTTVRALDTGMQKLTASQQETAIILERTNNRLTTLEQKPREARDWLNTATNGAGCLQSIVFGIVMVIFGVVNMLITIGIAWLPYLLKR